MKKIICIVLCLTSFVAVSFAEYVSGYYRRDGTYVNGHYRSDSNNTVTDNYSYKGNYNPYTGSKGKDKYEDSQSSFYYNPVKVKKWGY